MKITISRRRQRQILFVLAFALSAPVILFTASSVWAAPVNRGCLDCHDDYQFRVLFSGSVHGNNGCISCHTGIRDIGRHARGADKPTLVSCGSCHRDIALDYHRNFHYLQEDLRCYDCHQEIHGIKKRGKNAKLAILEGCTRCHSNEDYVASGHGEAILRGNQDAAACSDCHGLHDTRVFHTSLETYPAEAREFYTEKCKFCHADAQKMKRSGLSSKIVDYYEQTYHGKVQGIGYPTRVAGCADCHSYHNILPKEDPRSSIHSSNLVENCGRCHTDFHPRFVDYKAHPDYLDRKHYPALFWTFIFMTGLLVFTFGFFWVHTGLWWRKTYWEKHRIEKMGLLPGRPLERDEGMQQVERFTGKDRVLHVLLILSFFTLVMTGFPIKYHNAGWSKLLIQLWGGAHMAGLLHRAAALLLIAIVAYVGWTSFRYLFPAGQGTAGWKERLLGPDTLVPTWKDWEDMKGMFRWFFDRGEMPKFDRWTYWEKFDFWAVFWGMFAIGGSGFLLWKPEWSSYVVPGWVLNVAALVHSEEALLAALFIFTVHFFNTHFIPTKFPMDRLIFTGRYSLEEMREQRPLEYERLAKENRIEALKREYPSIPIKLVSGAFGLMSLLLGFLLTVLILWTILFN